MNKQGLEASKRNTWTYQIFTKYATGQLPSREFMYAIISTTYPKAIKSMTEDSMIKRIKRHKDEIDEMIDIDAQFKDEIMNILTQKSNK